MTDWSRLATSTQDAAPVSASPLCAGSPRPPGQPCGDVETFRLNNGKWARLPIEEVRNMTAGQFCFGPWLLKKDGKYYCGSDAVWFMLEDKGDARKWTYDYLIDNMGEYEEGILKKKLGAVIEI